MNMKVCWDKSTMNKKDFSENVHYTEHIQSRHNKPHIEVKHTHKHIWKIQNNIWVLRILGLCCRSKQEGSDDNKTFNNGRQHSYSKVLDNVASCCWKASITHTGRTKMQITLQVDGVVLVQAQDAASVRSFSAGHSTRARGHSHLSLTT